MVCVRRYPVGTVWVPVAAQSSDRGVSVCPPRQSAPADDPFPTTGDDLQGFWDMVLIQVHHIDAMMDELEAIRANNWQLPEVSRERRSAATAAQPRKLPHNSGAKAAPWWGQARIMMPAAGAN